MAGLGLLSALGLVLSVLAGVANGANGVNDSTDTSLTVDGDTHWFNANSMVSYGAYQYSAYWDAADVTTGDIYLKVTRRKLSDNSLQSVRLDGTGGAITEALANVNDGHNTVILGISPKDGRVHMSFSAHSAPHHYIKSSSGCMTQTTFSSGTCTFTSSSSQASPTTEDRLTYPQYFNDADGDLYMGYRHRSSDNSDYYLNKYNNNGTWTSMGMVFHGYNAGQDWDADGPAGPIGNSTHRGIYPWSWRFDVNDRLHVMWNWRESPQEAAGLSVQHDVYYAYSDDYGVTWKNNNATTVGTIDSDPITVLDTSTMVLSVPGGYWLGAGIMELDSNNQPHASIPYSDVQTLVQAEANMRQAHFWRTADGTWSKQFIQPTGDGLPMAYGGAMLFDGADDAHYFYAQYDRDWTPWNSDIYDQDELPYENVTNQDDGTQKYLNIVPHTAATAIDSERLIGIPITTASGANNNRKITVRMKNNTAATTFKVYWTTEASQAYSESKGQSFTITANDASWKTYTFTVSDADWTGTLRNLELNPVGQTDVSGPGKDVRIDYVRIQDDQTTPNVAKAWEFNSGMTIKEAVADADSNWSTWNISTILPDVNDSVNDAIGRLDIDLYNNGSRKVDFMLLEQGVPGIEKSVLHEFTIDGDTTAKDWNFPVDKQGWTDGGDISGFGYFFDFGPGSVGATITGADSAIVSAPNLARRIGTANKIVVRMKNGSNAATAKIYFITNSSTSWNETKSKSFSIDPNSGYTEYTVDMTGVSGWDSTKILRQLRLDPANDATTTGTFRVDRIHIKP